MYLNMNSLMKLKLCTGISLMFFQDHNMVLHENNNQLVMEEGDKDIPGGLQIGTSSTTSTPPSHPISPPIPSVLKPNIPTSSPIPVLPKPLAVKPSSKPRSKEYDPEFEAKPHK